MPIEVTLLISILSVGFAIFSGIINLKRNQSHDDKLEATQLTSVIVKLENIATGVTEIKSEMKSVKEDTKKNSERLTRVEESAKQAHKRLDTIEPFLRRRADDHE